MMPSVPTLYVGDRVRIQGVVSQPVHNGSVGTIKEILSGDRYGVVTELKPEGLSLAGSKLQLVAVGDEHLMLFEPLTRQFLHEFTPSRQPADCHTIQMLAAHGGSVPLGYVATWKPVSYTHLTLPTIPLV